MSQSTDVPLLGRSRPGRHVIGDLFVRLLREKPLGMMGAAIILTLLVCGSLAGLLAPYGMTEIDLEDRMATPSLEHLLGADHLGRDILSRIIYGARVSLIVGLAGTAVQVVVSTGIGIPSGYFGGKLDMVLQRLVDAWMSLPGLLVLLTVMSMVGRGTPPVDSGAGHSDRHRQLSNSAERGHSNQAERLLSCRGGHRQSHTRHPRPAHHPQHHGPLSSSYSASQSET